MGRKKKVIEESETLLDDNNEFGDIDDLDVDTSFDEKTNRYGKTTQYYVKEADLRKEIQLVQDNLKLRIESIRAKYQLEIDGAKDDAEKEKLTNSMDMDIEIAKTKPPVTEDLGKYILLTVAKVATQTKFRSYTYLDDMKAEAIFQSIRGIVKFNLEKTNDKGEKSSSFSYLTQIITNAFRQILKKEKRNREIRDQAIDSALIEFADLEIDFESIAKKREKMLNEH